jgi:hypothetical protein
MVAMSAMATASSVVLIAMVLFWRLMSMVCDEATLTIAMLDARRTTDL